MSSGGLVSPYVVPSSPYPFVCLFLESALSVNGLAWQSALQLHDGGFPQRRVNCTFTSRCSVETRASGSGMCLRKQGESLPARAWSLPPCSIAPWLDVGACLATPAHPPSLSLPTSLERSVSLHELSYGEVQSCSPCPFSSKDAAFMQACTPVSQSDAEPER